VLEIQPDNITFTTNTGISRVETVMGQDWPAGTLQQLAGTCATLNIIHKNVPTASTKVGIAICYATCIYKNIDKIWQI